MTTISAERPETTEVAVILGVDTHLDFHVGVAVDHLGREALARPGPKGRQPAPGLPHDGTGATAPPLARALDEGSRLGGRALPPRGRPY